MKLRILSSLALLLCLAPAAAAQTLAGRAVDRESLQPVRGAVILLVDTAGDPVAAARADSTGAFSVTAPGAGEFAISAARMGFRGTLTRLVPLQRGETVAVEVRMAREALAADTPALAPPTRRGISGRLVDDRTGQPLPGGRVTLLTARERRMAVATTDSAGTFHLEVPLAGGYVLRAERMGYRATQSAVLTVNPRDTVQVELRVATDAVVLAPLTVTAGSRRLLRDHQLAGFEWRREKQPFGRFMDKEQIQALNPFTATDVLQQMPTVRVAGGASYTQSIWLPARGQIRGVCRANIYVDGVLVRGLGDGMLNVNDLVRGRAMAGVELYSTPTVAPGEFPPLEDPGCGVIVIWTDLVRETA